MTNDIHTTQPDGPQQGEIILYQPDETVRLEVRLEDDTVWLTQQQMAELFGRERSVIAKHIGNCFREGELTAEEVCAKFAQTIIHGAIAGKVQIHDVTFYNLDVIISVGYRVKSPNGTKFRQWATRVLKNYLLRGAAIHQHLLYVKEEIDHHLKEHDQQLETLQSQVDFLVATNRLPQQGVFCNGQVFSARLFVEDLIKMAKNEIVLIDSYVDAKTFNLLDVRSPGVQATIYTERIDASLQRLQQLHNQEHGNLPVSIATFSRSFHDRFLVIDNELWHCGASFKDLGRKLFAIDRLNRQVGYSQSTLTTTDFTDETDKKIYDTGYDNEYDITEQRRVDAPPHKQFYAVRRRIFFLSVADSFLLSSRCAFLRELNESGAGDGDNGDGRGKNC